jgi:hypothetical protein
MALQKWDPKTSLCEAHRSGRLAPWLGLSTCYPQVTRVKHVVYLPGWRLQTREDAQPRYGETG